MQKQKLIALHFNNSKKVAQLVKRIGFFKTKLQEFDMLKAQIINSFSQQLSEIIQDNIHQQENIHESIDQLYSSSMTELLKVQGSVLPPAIVKIQKQFSSSAQKIENKIKSQLETVQKVSSKFDQLFIDLEQQISIDKFNQDFQSRLSRIHKAQAEEIQALNKKNQHDIQTLMQQHEERCKAIEEGFKAKKEESSFSSKKNQLNQLFLLLPSLSNSIQDILATFSKAKEQLLKKYQPLIKEIKALQSQYSAEEKKLKDSYSFDSKESQSQSKTKSKSKSNDEKKAIKQAYTQEINQIKRQFEEYKVLFEYKKQIINQKIQFEKFLQSFISEINKENAYFEELKQIRLRIVDVKTAEEEIQKLKEEKEKVLTTYQNNINISKANKKINPKMKSVENDIIKSTRNQYDEEFRMQSQLSQKKILKLQDSILEEEEHFSETLKHHSQNYHDLHSLKTLENQYNSLEQYLASLEDNSGTESQESKTLEKNNQTNINGKKKDQSIKKNKNEKSEKSKSNDSNTKDLSTKDSNEKDSNDTSNKSFQRELQSLETAKASANKLAEKKKKEFLDQKGKEMIEENERHSNKLKEINKHSDELQGQITILKKQIEQTKREKVQIHQMSHEFSAMQFQRGELIDSAQDSTTKDFTQLHSKYEKMMFGIYDQIKQLEIDKEKSTKLYLSEKAQLEKKLKNLKSSKEKSITRWKSETNSKLSLKKIEYLDGLEELQVRYASEKNTTRREWESFEEEIQMKKSIKELELKDIEAKYEKSISNEKTKLMGIKGFYEERESVLREKLEKIKLKHELSTFKGKT